MTRFVIVTSGDLPEACFLAKALESRRQPFAIVNVVARRRANRLAVLARLRRKHGVGYVADLLFDRMLDHTIGRWHGKSWVGAFPEIDGAEVQRLRRAAPRIECTDPHTPEVLGFVRAFDPDYMLLAGAPIVRPSLYGLARYGALNRHLGLLPEFRGSDCAVWAFAVNRPECAGYSIHSVSERVDAGAVVVRRHVALADEPTLGDFLRRLQRQASSHFVTVIDRILEGGRLVAMPQEGRGQYFPPAGWSAFRRATRNYGRVMAARRVRVRAALAAR
jgi:folate-dependent phosphoribosylglycinamide formyltransferase PurN